MVKNKKNRTHTNLKSQFFLFFILVVLFIFSGCSSIKIEQTIENDGSSVLDIFIDYSSYKNADKISDGCSEFFSDDINCNNLEDKSLRVVYKVDKLDGFVSDSDLIYSSYSYDLNKVEKLLQSINSTKKGSILKRNLKNYEDLGFDFKYTITMPNRIKQDGFGLISGNKIEVDFNTISDDAILRSQQVNNYIYVLSASILIIILFVIFNFYHNKKKKKKISESKKDDSLTRFKEEISANKISDAEIKCRDYIFQYKNNFPKESIEKVLVDAGFNSDDVEKWINKYY